MTIEIKTFDTRDEAVSYVRSKAVSGYHARHYDLIDGKIRVTLTDIEKQREPIELTPMREIDFVDMLAKERGFILS